MVFLPAGLWLYRQPSRISHATCQVAFIPAKNHLGPFRQFSADSPCWWPASACPSSSPARLLTLAACQSSRAVCFRRRIRPRGGFHQVPATPGIPRSGRTQTPLPPNFLSRRLKPQLAVLRFGPLQQSGSQPAYTCLPRSMPLLLPEEAESLRQVPPPAWGRGLSSGSGPSSAVSVSGRCALGTGRRWLAPWLRLLSRRRLLLPVARAAGRSGVLVSDAAEV